MENVKNVNLVYGVVGLILGLAIAGVSCWNNHHRDMGMRHKMPDGSMMNNKKIDMHSTMGGMMAGLEGKTGDAFDKEFLSEMIVHHEGAVEMAQAVLATSKRPELLQLANDIISAQTKEIGMMQEWQKQWFK